jgi:VCBS repeat-containing protein
MSRSRPSKFLALKLVALAAICSVGLIAMPAAASAAAGTCVVYGPEGGAPLTDNTLTVVAGSSTELRLSCSGSATAATYTVDNTTSTGYFNGGAGSGAGHSSVDTPTGADLIGSFIASAAPDGQYTDTFTFTATNSADTFPVVPVHVLINPAPPVCTITNSADDNQNVVQGTEARTHVAFTCTANGDGPAFFSGPVQGEHGLFSTDTNGTTVDYVANAHDSGADTVALIAHTANSGFSEPLFFHYTVTDATPTCTPINETLQGGQDAELSSINFEPRCSDADDTLSYRAADGATGAQGTYGYLSLTGNQGDYREDPSAAASLTAPVTETFQVEVIDGNPDHVVTVPVTITITPDHAPVCTTVSGDDNQSVVHGNNSISIGIVCADPDSGVNPGDAFFAVDLDQDSLPTQGNASINDAQNEITYTSNYEGLGSDTIAVVASSGALSRTLLIHVNVTDNAPACADTSLSMTNDSSDGADLTCTDADGDFVDYNVGQAPQNGTVFQSGTFFYYVPNDGFVGTDTFTVLADDGSMQTPITVTAHVSAAPPLVVDPPVVVAPVLVPVVTPPVVTPPVVVPPVAIVAPPAPKLSSPVTVKDGKVALELGCANTTTSCKASVALTTTIAGKTLSLGQKAITIKPGKNGAISVSLSSAAKLALKAFAGKTITVKVAVKTTNPKTGKTVIVSKAMKVKVPR